MGISYILAEETNPHLAANSYKRPLNQPTSIIQQCVKRNHCLLVPFDANFVVGSMQSS